MTSVRQDLIDALRQYEEEEKRKREKPRFKIHMTKDETN